MVAFGTFALGLAAVFSFWMEVLSGVIESALTLRSVMVVGRDKTTTLHFFLFFLTKF